MVPRVPTGLREALSVPSLRPAPKQKALVQKTLGQKALVQKALVQMVLVQMVLARTAETAPPELRPRSSPRCLRPAPRSPR